MAGRSLARRPAGRLRCDPWKRAGKFDRISDGIYSRMECSCSGADNRHTQVHVEIREDENGPYVPRIVFLRANQLPREVWPDLSDRTIRELQTRTESLLAKLAEKECR